MALNLRHILTTACVLTIAAPLLAAVVHLLRVSS